MDVKLHCNNPACQQKLVVDESYLGRSFQCPACGTVLLVPAPVRSVSSMPATTEPNIETPLTLNERIFRLLIVWGIGLAVCALLMASLRIRASFMQISSTSRLDQITKDVVAPGGLLNVAPVSNYKETALIYERDVGNGVGFFLADLITLERKQIELASAAKIPPRLIGWSPDDRYLAFAVTDKKAQNNQKILIRDGSTGVASDSFDLPDSLEQGAWLSTNSLVLYARHKLYLFNFQEDSSNLGRYGKQGLILLPFDSLVVPTSLVPIGGRAVAYDNGNNIWFYSITGNRATQLTHMTNVNIGELDYNPKNASFLFSLTVSGKRADPSLFRFDPRTNTVTGGIAQFTDQYNFDRIYGGNWIAEGAGLVYAGQNSLGISLSGEGVSLHTNLFTGGRYLNYSVSPHGDKIFAIASLAGEPLGIWEYDINYGNLDNVVPPKEHLAVSQWAAPVPVEIGTKRGERLVYSLLSPPNLTAGKKHPAVLNLLGDNPYDAWPQLMANTGIFSVSVHPKTPEEAKAIVDDLIKHANVDPQRLYIVGQKTDAAMIKSLLNSSPGLWRGVILIQPSEFPQFQDMPPAMTKFLVFGGSNGDIIYALKAERFLQTACQKLVSSRLLFDEDIKNGSVKTDLNQERYMIMAGFILTGDFNE